MKLYYVLTCVVLPAAMMAACSTSGEKKPTTNIAEVTTHSAIVKKANPEIKNQLIVPLSEKIEITSSENINIPDAEKFPLTQNPDNINLVKPSKRMYQFGFNKHEITPEDQLSLQAHADYLLNNPESILEINGHSDTQGNKLYNTFLSKERAKKVAEIIINYGAPKEQIKVVGLGDSEPLNDVKSFSENRRVELEYNDSRLAVK